MGEQKAYQCRACGNRTRFTVELIIESKTYFHFTLGGRLIEKVDEQTDVTIKKVTCRWCTSTDIEEYEPLEGEEAVEATATT